MVIDTMPCIMVGPFSAGGVNQYIANYTNPCGTFADTVTVIVPTCSAPTNIGGSALSANSVEVAWDSIGTGATNFDVEYGPAGFALGTGTRVTATGISTSVTGLPANLCQEFYVRASCSAVDTSAWIGPVNVCPDVTLCTEDFDQYNSGVQIEPQSTLFIPWQGGAGGDSEVSSAQSVSGTQSLNITDKGPAGFTDVVAYFDTITSGAWELTWDMYVKSGDGAYYNIQQNHAIGGVGNLWNAELYFQANGSCQIQHSAAATVVGSFNYTQGQWFEMTTIIDLTNDSIWFETNGSSTGLGYDYSDANLTPMQFNGVNFFSGVLAGSTTTWTTSLTTSV
ncbi:MAG: fibronectin type III domain-containing protein [Owenweeksia sp.]|nr:fibronectin type III domain-containing protein [Owenweeksia sp.]